MMSSSGTPSSPRPRARNRRSIFDLLSNTSGAVTSSTSLPSTAPSSRASSSTRHAVPHPNSSSSSNSRIPTALFSQAPDDSRRNHHGAPATRASTYGGAGLLEAGWSSITSLASSLIGEQPFGRENGEAGAKGSGNARPYSKANSSTDNVGNKMSNRMSNRMCAEEIASGVMAQREADLRARRTASVLESHNNVNGGLDVAGRYKRRTSDDLGSSVVVAATNREGTPLGAGRRSARQGAEDDYCLVYVHHVAPTDTCAGVVLKYRCRDERVIRKANGLSNLAHIAIKRYLLIPIDACDIRGKPCDPPGPSSGGGVDLLAPTPADKGGTGVAALQQEEREASSLESPIVAREKGKDTTQGGGDDYFGAWSKRNGLGCEKAGRICPEQGRLAKQDVPSEPQTEDQPWEHVRWVRLDGLMTPVEIGRAKRRYLSYYPPHRRKRSIQSSMSFTSTPRQSLDCHATSSNPPGRASLDSHTVLYSSLRPIDSTTQQHGTNSSISSHRSRLGSISTARDAADPRPAWMRGPGGIGTLGNDVRTPGPKADALNKWARKHFAKFMVDDLPSMSVVGSERARFGFDDEPAEIAQGVVNDPTSGVDARTTATAGGDSGASGGGINLDKMAVGVESWLREAWQWRPVVVAGAGGGVTTAAERSVRARVDSDLIELEDASDDGSRLSSADPGTNVAWSSGGGATAAAAVVAGVNSVAPISRRVAKVGKRD